MGRRKAIRTGLLFGLGGLFWRSRAEDLSRFFDHDSAPVPTLNGFLRVHDPSTIVRDGSKYWIFTTGGGIGSRFSSDMVNWERGPRVFDSPPAWTAQAVPDFKGSFWAPSRTLPLEPTQIAPDFSTTGSKAAARPPVIGSLALPRDTRFETTTRFTGSLRFHSQVNNHSSIWFLANLSTN